MSVSDEDMDARFGEVHPPANLDEIHEELVSIKCSIESIEEMVRDARETAIAVFALGVIGFLGWKYF